MSSHITGDVSEAVRHARTIRSQIHHAQGLDTAELYTYAKELQAPFDLLQRTTELGRLPVVNFAAGGLGNYSLLLTTNIYCFCDIVPPRKLINRCCALVCFIKHL
jgi:hypothetical protein